MAYSLKEILKNLNVLFISQKEMITQREIDILKRFFHKIIFAHSSKKALSLFEHEHPDVILSDIKIQDESGIDICKKIKRLNHNIPIIILSQYKDENYLFEIIRLQVIDFILRPMKVENMIFALNQTAKHILNHGNVTYTLNNGYIYNYRKKTIIQKDGKISQLTKNEFRLIELLITNKKQTLSKKEIETYLWANEEITESAFKSLFSRIRQKIGKESIQNSFGIGYQLI